MPTAQLYLFSDASPDDWLINGGDKRWHTIVNLLIQPDPALYRLIDEGKDPNSVLEQDRLFLDFVAKLQAELPQKQLKKWKTGPSYRTNFCKAFLLATEYFDKLSFWVNACSFQEQTLRASKSGLVNSYNSKIGGVEGQGIGFNEFTDRKGRTYWKHAFINFFGYHEIKCPENQMLVLLFMAWFIADQYTFYWQELINSPQYGFDHLKLTIMSDRLSGDNDIKSISESNLRNLIDPKNTNSPILLTRSPESDQYPGDLLVDNLAGWLNSAISKPESEYAKKAVDLTKTSVCTGWHELIPSYERLEAVPAISRISPK